MNCPVISVTDHALLRWLERIHGIDVEHFRQKLREEAVASLDAFGEAREGDAGTFIIDNGAVVTVLAPGMRALGARGRTSISVPRAEMPAG